MFYSEKIQSVFINCIPVIEKTKIITNETNLPKDIKINNNKIKIVKRGIYLGQLINIKGDIERR